MFGEHVTIQFYKARKNDLEAQITENSMTLRLKQKLSSNEVTEIHEKCHQEQQMVRNEIDSLDDKSGSEYKELMAELEEMKSDEDEQVKKAEDAAADYENQIEQENTGLETEVQAITADLEGLEEMRKQSIEDNFGYFQK